MPRLEWHRYVHVPLRECDYDLPLIARLQPFVKDSAEVDLALAFAAVFLWHIPLWRRFKDWPVCEVNAVKGKGRVIANNDLVRAIKGRKSAKSQKVRGHRVTEAGYAELCRMLEGYGYAKEVFSLCPLADIAELLDEGARRSRQAARLQCKSEADGGSRPDRVNPREKPNEQIKTLPNDPIRLGVVVDKYIVSRSTLQRAVDAKRLTSYRRGEKGPHVLSEADVQGLYPRRLL